MNDAELQRAEHARDVLAAEILDRPEVSMIDIGQDQADGSPILRVHVRDAGMLGGAIPPAVEGVPVQVLLGAYRPQV